MDFQPPDSEMPIVALDLEFNCPSCSRSGLLKQDKGFDPLKLVGRSFVGDFSFQYQLLEV